MEHLEDHLLSTHGVSVRKTPSECVMILTDYNHLAGFRAAFHTLDVVEFKWSDVIYAQFDLAKECQDKDRSRHPEK